MDRGPPECSTSSRQVVSTDVSLSKESSDSAPSAPSTVNTNDHYNDKSSGESGCGKTSLRPDAAAAVPVVVPGRFGRGFGRAPTWRRRLVGFTMTAAPSGVSGRRRVRQQRRQSALSTAA